VYLLQYGRGWGRPQVRYGSPMSSKPTQALVDCPVSENSGSEQPAHNLKELASLIMSRGMIRVYVRLRAPCRPFAMPPFAENPSR
jgi:hypothetical protein